MGIWGMVIVVVVVLLVVALLVALRGEEGRAAARQLRQLRAAEGRGVNGAEIAARRRGMTSGHTPGADSAAGGFQ